MIRAKVVNGVVKYFEAGVEVAPRTTPESNLEKNQRELITKASAAITVNNTYVARAAPTTAQNTAQIKALSRECTAIIKLLLKQLDDTTGT
jgi:hypothetical protein